MTSKPIARAFLLAASLTAMSGAAAMYLTPDVQQVPLARIVRNITAASQRNPRDVSLLINLARAHAMAWSLRSDSVPAIVSDKPPGLGMPGDTIRGKPIEPMQVWFYPDAPNVQFVYIKPVNDSAVIRRARVHLDSALAVYRRALAMQPNDRIARLGYGWLLSKTPDRKSAIAELRKSVSALPSKPLKAPADIVDIDFGAEAAGYLIPLLDSKKDAKEVQRLNDRIEQARRVPRVVTPIAIPLSDNLRAKDIENRDARVAFDADGLGEHNQWSWIKPNAAWLVYDHEGRGRINSALQMFGSVTFWMFWSNGYDALASLDDNGDGRLTGTELRSLALWRDANSNGISERGEVRSVAQFNIVEISCRYVRDDAHPDRIAYAPVGVKFRNGKTRPTFDVVLHRAPVVVAGRR